MLVVPLITFTDMDLSTAIEHRGGEARFVVNTADPLCANRLVHMGYLPVRHLDAPVRKRWSLDLPPAETWLLQDGDERFATLWFPRSPAVERYHERFAASIEQMVVQSARLVRVPWEDALLEFLGRVQGSGLNWWLYGSAALAIRGFDVEPGDIDLNIDDAARAGELFDDVLVTPVLRMKRWAANYTGRAFCHAIIEWASDPHAYLDDASAPSEQGPFMAEHLESVTWRGYPIPVPPLAAQLRSCERRGLADRAAIIRAAMSR